MYVCVYELDVQNASSTEDGTREIWNREFLLSYVLYIFLHKKYIDIAQHFLYWVL